MTAGTAGSVRSAFQDCPHHNAISGNLAAALAENNCRIVTLTHFVTVTAVLWECLVSDAPMIRNNKWHRANHAERGVIKVWKVLLRASDPCPAMAGYSC